MTGSIGTADLPAGLAHRRPAVADDARILPLVVACDLRVVGSSDATLVQVRADLAGPGVDNERGGRLVENSAGDVVGWLWTEAIETGSEVFLDLYSLEPRVLEWLVRRAFDYVELLVSEWDRPVRVKAGCYQHDEEYGAILRSAGFEVVRSFWEMKRSLEEVSPEPPPLPAGVTIRTLDATRDDERRLYHRLAEDAFVDHWDNTPLPFEEWYALLDASAGRDVTQWWVAEFDGEPAGLLIGADSRAELGEGYVDVLGVLRPFRGRGVAKALLWFAFAEFVRRGRTRAALGVDSESPTGATRLYEAVGMSVDKVILAQQQTVAPVSR